MPVSQRLCHQQATSETTATQKLLRMANNIYLLETACRSPEDTCHSVSRKEDHMNPTFGSLHKAQLKEGIHMGQSSPRHLQLDSCLAGHSSCCGEKHWTEPHHAYVGDWVRGAMLCAAPVVSHLPFPQSPQNAPFHGPAERATSVWHAEGCRTLPAHGCNLASCSSEMWHFHSILGLAHPQRGNRIWHLAFVSYQLL